jgi:spermidine synthase
MYKSSGTLIHRCHDAEGILEVIDHTDLRSLYFGTPDLQSRMRLSDPSALMVSYTRAMLAPLLFMERPGSVLLLGLGGGSLAKFLLHHFPHCRVQVVERREAVIDLAHDYFSLPHDRRLDIYLGDAEVFLRTIARQSYELILVDIYNAWGPAQALSGSAFFPACRERLTPHGIVSVNLWRSMASRPHGVIARLEEVFAGQLWELPVPDKDNLIVLGFRHALPSLESRALRKRAHDLNAELDIEFPRFLKDLQRHNVV